MTTTLHDPASIVVREYTTYRTGCNTFAEATAMFDAIHAEARACIDNLADMAQRALDRGDIDVARTLLRDIARHEAVRDWIEAAWQ